MERAKHDRKYVLKDIVGIGGRKAIAAWNRLDQAAISFHKLFPGRFITVKTSLNECLIVTLNGRCGLNDGRSSRPRLRARRSPGRYLDKGI